MAIALLLRRDPAGLGVAFGLIAAAGFLIAPAAPPLLLALALVLIGNRAAQSVWQGMGVGALIGLAALKGVMESAGYGVDPAPWAAAAAAGVVPLALAWARRRNPSDT